MGKRTNTQIKKDYERIKAFAEVTKALTINELAKEVEMSPAQVCKSLEQHPRVKQRVLKKLEQNRANNKPKQVKMVQQPKMYLIDASVVCVAELQQIIADNPIILTDIAISKFEKIQHSKDFRGLNARTLLRRVAEEHTTCKCVKVQEENLSQEQSIIKFCLNNKEDVILLTSNPVLTLNARAHFIEVEFVRQTKIDWNMKKRSTLYNTEMEDGKLVINKFETQYRKTVVKSNEQQYSHGTYALNIGDEVFTATLKKDHLVFAHYKIVSLEKENNCELVYSKRIMSEQDLNALPQEYQAFMLEFKRAKMA